MSNEPKDSGSGKKAAGGGPRGTRPLFPPAVAVPSFRSTVPMDPAPEAKARPKLVVVTEADARPYARTDVTPKPAPEVEDADFDPRATSSFADEALALAPGEKVGSYEILGLIARGGFAEIYEATNPVLQEQVAIKVLQRKFATRADLAYRMEVEARTLAQLRGHPHIVRIFDAGRDARTGVFIVMERLRGKTLRDLIEVVGPMSIREAVGIAIYLALATHDLHLLEVVHRDLKPENVFLHKDGKSIEFAVRLLDLGIVRKKGDVSSSSRCLGTPLYMSPEQIARGEVVPASDQYSLAHILYEMLRGAHVWRADAAKLMPGQEIATLYWHITREIPELPGSLCPAPLWKIIARALSREPADRFPTMKVFSDSLLDFLEVHSGHKLIVENEVAKAAARVQALMKSPAKISEPAPPVSTAKPAPNATLSPKSTSPRAAPGRGRVPSPLESELAVPSLVVGTSMPFGQAGQRFPLSDGAVIGRKHGAVDIYLDQDSISRVHVELKRFTRPEARATLGDEIIYEVVDLGSSNGVEIDGIPTKTGLVRVFSKLHVGDVVLTLVPPGSLDSKTTEFYPLGKRKQAATKKSLEQPPQKKGARKDKEAAVSAKPKLLKRATMVGGVPEGWTGGDVRHLPSDLDLSKPYEPVRDRRQTTTIIIMCVLVLAAIVLGYIVYKQRTP